MYAGVCIVTNMDNNIEYENVFSLEGVAEEIQNKDLFASMEKRCTIEDYKCHQWGMLYNFIQFGQCGKLLMVGTWIFS